MESGTKNRKFVIKKQMNFLFFLIVINTQAKNYNLLFNFSSVIFTQKYIRNFFQMMSGTDISNQHKCCDDSILISVIISFLQIIPLLSLRVFSFCFCICQWVREIFSIHSIFSPYTKTEIKLSVTHSITLF